MLDREESEEGVLGKERIRDVVGGTIQTIEVLLINEEHLFK